jgi:hypothetical protein
MFPWLIWNGCALRNVASCMSDGHSSLIREEEIHTIVHADIEPLFKLAVQYCPDFGLACRRKSVLEYTRRRIYGNLARIRLSKCICFRRWPLDPSQLSFAFVAMSRIRCRGNLSTLRAPLHDHYLLAATASPLYWWSFCHMHAELYETLLEAEYIQDTSSWTAARRCFISFSRHHLVIVTSSLRLLVPFLFFRLDSSADESSKLRRYRSAK